MSGIDLRTIYRNATTLAAGTGIGQLASLICLPLLAWAYGPQAFGEYALFVLLVTVAGVPCSAGLGPAVLKPAADGDAGHLVSAGMRLAILQGIAVLPLLLFGAWVADLALLGSGVALLAGLVAVMASGAQSMLAYWLLRQGAFAAVSSARALMPVIMAGTALAAHAQGMAGGLLLAFALGMLGSTLLLLICARRRGLIGRPAGGPGESWRVVRRHRDYLRWSAPQAAIDAGRDTAVGLIIASGFDPSALGHVHLVQRAIGAPLALIGNALAQAIVREIARLIGAAAPFLALYHRLLRSLVLVVVPVGLAIMALGPPLLILLLGDEWRPAGLYVLVLVPWFCAQFLTAPLFAIPPLIDRQPGAFAWGVIYAVGQLAALGTAWWLQASLAVSLAAISWTSAAILVLALLWLNRACREHHAGRDPA